MAPTVLKASRPLRPEARADIEDTVRIMLARLRSGGAEAARDYAMRLDGWQGEIVVPPHRRAAAARALPEGLREAIGYAHDNIRRFAEAQRASATDMQVELRPGLVAGQRQIPVHSAGCYVPGGRYAHIASALMTIATARAAGVAHVTACAPPRGGAGIAPEVLYAMDLAGADDILCLGGVQGVAALAFGLFGQPPADVLAGPGNAYVAEAKRQLYGPIGIDMVAGPTDLLICADASADPARVALDLVGQAEHGATSPVWLLTDHEPLAREVLLRLPATFARLPDENRRAAEAAWEACGEVLLCRDRQEMAETADAYAPEHLQVMAEDTGWWLENLTAYGSLFLGHDATTAFGDKASGTNHVLPTGGAARYTGGLSVHKFLKTVTWQRVDPEALPELASATAAISRAEGMVGHALTAEDRLPKAKRVAAG